MNKKILPYGFALIIAGMAVFSSAYSNALDQIHAHEEKIKQVNASRLELELELHTKNEYIKELNTSINTLDSSVNSLETKLDELSMVSDKLN